MFRRKEKPIAHQCSAVLGLSLCVAACHRYEYRPVSCHSYSPVAASAIAWQATSGKAGTVVVRVVGVTVTDTVLLTTSSARLDAGGWRPPGKDGLVRFDSIKFGPHALAVRALGYGLATATVVVPPDSGVSAVAGMAQHVIMLDGCGMLVECVSKPWWKLW